MRPRLVVLLPAGGLAGVQRTHVEMATALVDRGWDVHTIIPGDPSGLDVLLKISGLPWSGMSALPWWQAEDAPLDDASSETSPELVGLVTTLKPDVVLTHSAVIAEGSQAARRLGLPHVWYLHEFGDLDHDLQLPMSAPEWGSLVASASDVVLCNSSAVLRHFFPDDAVDSSIVVLPYEVDMPLMRASRAAGSGTRIAVIGTLQPGKGQELAIRALQRVRSIHPDATLHLYGSGSPREILRLKRLAEREAVQGAVVFHGFVNDREDIYSATDLVLVPSRSEAYGRVPDEAALAGIPIVFVPSGGLSERLVHGCDGFAAEGLTPDAVATAIITVLASGDLQRTLVDGARQSIRARVSAALPHDRLDAILRGLAGP